MISTDKVQELYFGFHFAEYLQFDAEGASALASSPKVAIAATDKFKVTGLNGATAMEGLVITAPIASRGIATIVRTHGHFLDGQKTNARAMIHSPTMNTVNS